MDRKEARNILLLRSCSDCKHFDMDTADCDWGIFEECTEAYYIAIQALQEPERKKGQWIQSYPDIEPNPMYMYSICSVCGGEQSIRYDLPFCPWCGSKNGEDKTTGEDNK